jgi:hypothetical protein
MSPLARRGNKKNKPGLRAGLAERRWIMERKMKIKLIEEVAPSEVIPREEAEKVLWNSPPPLEVRYRVEGDIDPKALSALNWADWDEDFLEEMDLFHLLPGIRVFGADAPQKLRDLGYDVVVITKAEIIEARRRYEEALRRQKEERRREEERREKRWKALHRFASKKGLVKLTEVWGAETFMKVNCTIPFRVWYSGTPDKLDVGTSTITGDIMLILRYGNAIAIFADPKTAEAICEAVWEERCQQEDPAVVYFWALVGAEQYPNCLGAEWDRWVVKNKADLLPVLVNSYKVVIHPQRGDRERIIETCLLHGIAYELGGDAFSCKVVKK